MIRRSPRSSFIPANIAMAYVSMPAARLTEAMNWNRSPIPRPKLSRVTALSSRLDTIWPRTGVPARLSTANHCGNTPPRAIAQGISPCSMMKPLSVPNALIAANTATAPATPAPKCRPRKLATGAGLAAASPIGM